MFKIKFLSYLQIVVVGLFVLLFAKQVSAAQLTFKVVPNQESTDMTTIVELRIDPQGKNINVLEGVINFQGELAEKLIVGVETGGSILTLWTTAPQYLVTEKAIRFVGGTPGGFDKDSLVMRLRLASPLSGKLVISWLGGAAYRNDGQGTKENVFAKSTTLSLDKQELDKLAESSLDNTAPSFKFVDMGRDDSVYDGKYFISFTAVDDSSGVARYEVIEGNQVTELSEGTYVLKDQSRRTPLSIRAYDKNGNSSTAEIPARINWLKYVILLLIIVSVSAFLLLNVLRKKIKK